MALGSLPSLTQINTELGVSGQSLSKCIVLANKLGVWDKQSDFAGYSYGTIDVTPPSILITTSTTTVNLTVDASGSWTRVLPFPSEVWKIIPTIGDGASNSVSLLLNPYSGSPEVFTVVFELDSDTSITDNIQVTRR